MVKTSSPFFKLCKLTWSPDDLPALLLVYHILGDVQLHPELVPAVLLHLALLLLLHSQPGQAPAGQVRQETHLAAHHGADTPRLSLCV